jgi:hypothetical protein
MPLQTTPSMNREGVSFRNSAYFCGSEWLSAYFFGLHISDLTNNPLEKTNYELGSVTRSSHLSRVFPSEFFVPCPHSLSSQSFALKCTSVKDLTFISGPTA